jgi:cytoskeletal protein RodZ
MSRSLGNELRQSRLDQGLSLDEVAKATHIKLRYLEALERGDLEALPSSAQARGFVRVYANFLDQDPDLYLSLLDGVDFEAAENASFNPYQGGETQPTETELALQQVSEETARRGDELLKELGQRLRQRRETLGLTLEDVERHTHLRLHYLRALEMGDPAALPSPVQGRGMLKNYSDFLGLDADAQLLLFADALQAQYTARQPERTRPRPPEKQPKRISPIRRLMSGDLFLTGVIILLVVSFVGWGVFQIASARSEQTPEPDPPSIADVLAASSTPSTSPTASPTPAAGADAAPVPGLTPGVTGEAPAEVSGFPTLDPQLGGLQVYISAAQRAYLRVVVDGEIQFEGQVLIGTVYPFTGEETIEVTTGNGAGITVYYNNQNLGQLGGFGEVVTRIFTPEQILLPTATITPTPTETPRVTPTPPATNMPGGQP